ncbi:hypothetical protein HHI36_012565 [Cryptolaemus montrouzieri]|uniref:UDP-glucuronosyltransferase n=1 Tax=Cryptolaemus montrouzieri TaxID=559131 RepID=A0ABD2NEL6_9CUCU
MINEMKIEKNMRKFLLCNILQIICYIGNAENANILAIFPVRLKSHLTMAMKIAEGLSANGHTVDLYNGFRDGKLGEGINQILVPDAKDMILPSEFIGSQKISIVERITAMFEYINAGNDQCRNILSTSNDVMNKLRNTKKHYDLILIELFLYDCFFGFAHSIKAPIVAMTSSVDLPWGANRIGNPDNPSYIPIYHTSLGKDMTLFERIYNTFALMYGKYRHRLSLQTQQQIAEEFFGSDVPSLNNIISNTSLFLLNSHFSLNQARPNLPNVIEVAGLHIGELKPLSKEFLDIIGDSKFIYFSFGSVFKSEAITTDKLQHICDAFEKLNYPVLWKADKKDIPKGLVVPKNVYTKRWMPQLDILCHPNILFFMTHSGLMGTEEAVYCGVPMLSIPLFADQFLNSKNVQDKGIAIAVELDKVSNLISDLMKELIENPKYKQNAKKLSEEFKDRPKKPLDEAVYWIEYVLRHKGAPQLKSKSVDLVWYQYYLLDVGGIILFLLIISLTVIYKTFKYSLKCMKRKKGVNDKKKQ